MKATSRLVRIVRAKSSLTLARILGTVASAVALALLASQLRSLFGSLAVVAVTSVLSLTIAEVVRITLEITGEKARAILPLPETEESSLPPSEPEPIPTEDAPVTVRGRLWRRWYIRYGVLLLSTGLITTAVNWWMDHDDPAPVTVIQNSTERVGLSDTEQKDLLDKAESQLQPVQSEVESLKNQLGTLDRTAKQRDVEDLSTRLAVAEDTLGGLQAQLDELRAVLEEHGSRLDQLDSRLDDLENRLTEQAARPAPSPSQPAPSPTPTPAGKPEN